MPREKVSVTKLTSKIVPIVSFANGTVRESKKRKLSLGIFKSTDRTQKKMKQKIVVAESSKMVYRGLNIGPLATDSGSSQLYVAEVNRSTGKMTVYPAELFKLHPVLDVDVEREQLNLDSMSLREKTDVLTDAFGSRKQKRALKTRQRNKLAEGAVSTAMESIIDSAIVEQQAHTPVVAKQDSQSAIPPYNKDADSPAGVYNLRDIIGEIESLKTPARDFFESSREKIAEWQEQKKYFPSVLSRVGIMPLDDELRWKSACCLMYLQYMMTVYLMKHVQLRKKDPLPEDWPDAIKRVLLGRFTLTVDKRRCVPARLRDLLLSHIFVLCLILDDFTLGLSQLHTDLKLSANKLTTHIRALGCKVKSESSTDATGNKTTLYTAKLIVPLTFPEPRTGRKAKK